MGKKVKAFFRDFLQSLLPQPTFYRKVIRRNFFSSLKYFAILIFALNLIFFSLMFSLRLGKTPDLSLKGFKSALAAYPPDLIVEIKDGGLTTNYSRPYFFWVKDGNKQFLLAVISPTSTSEEIREFESPLLLTGKNIVFSGGTKLNSFPYSNLHLIVNKQTVNTFAAILEGLTPFLVVLSFLFVFIVAPFFAVVGSFIYMVIISIFCYFIFSIYSKKNNFKKTLKISLHAVTLPFLVKYVMIGLGYNMDRAWPVFSLLVFVFILSALYETYLDQ